MYYKKVIYRKGKNEFSFLFLFFSDIIVKVKTRKWENAITKL